MSEELKWFLAVVAVLALVAFAIYVLPSLVVGVFMILGAMGFVSTKKPR